MAWSEGTGEEHFMPQKQIYVLLYDEFADFEIIQALFLLREEQITFVGFKEQVYTSICQLKVLANMQVADVNIDDVDLLLIPGGEPKHLITNPALVRNVEELNTLLRALDQNKTKIAAICGGPTFLAHAGLLSNRKCTGSVAEDEKRFFTGTLFHDVDVVRDGHILTAQGHAFTEFALEIGTMLGLFSDDSEKQAMLHWLRNVKQ